MAGRPTDRDWDIRLFIYQFFIEQALPPEIDETAEQFGISSDEARDAYRCLHDAHTIFLEPGTHSIRIANPLSAVPTDYRVEVGNRWLYANCAWDSLGVPAMLGSDARIEAREAHSREVIEYAIEDGELKGDGGLVHFPIPFRHWYDDLIHT